MKYIVGVCLILLGVMSALSVAFMPGGGDTFTGLIASILTLALALAVTLLPSSGERFGLRETLALCAAGALPLVAVIATIAGAPVVVTLVVLVLATLAAVAAGVFSFHGRRGGAVVGTLVALSAVGLAWGFAGASVGTPAGVVFAALVVAALSAVMLGVLALAAVHTAAIGDIVRTPEADPAVSKVTDR